MVHVELAQVGFVWQVPIDEWPDGLRAKMIDGELDVLPDSRRQTAERAIEEILTHFEHV